MALFRVRHRPCSKALPHPHASGPDQPLRKVPKNLSFRQSLCGICAISEISVGARFLRVFASGRYSLGFRRSTERRRSPPARSFTSSSHTFRSPKYSMSRAFSAAPRSCAQTTAARSMSAAFRTHS